MRVGVDDQVALDADITHIGRAATAVVDYPIADEQIVAFGRDTGPMTCQSAAASVVDAPDSA